MTRRLWTEPAMHERKELVGRGSVLGTTSPRRVE